MSETVTIRQHNAKKCRKIKLLYLVMNSVS